MTDYTYIRLIYNLLADDFPALVDNVSSILSTVEMLLQAGVFFGFLFTAYKFISSRWLVLNG